MEFRPRFETIIDIYEHSLRTFSSCNLFGTKQQGRWQWITYAHFGEEVDIVRAGLQQLGVTRGDAVAIIANNCIEWAVAAFATYSLGAVFVPMYEAQRVNDWEFVLRDCEAKVLLIVNKSILQNIIPLLEAIPTLETLLLFRGERASVKAPSGKRIATYAELLRSSKPTPLFRPSRDDIAAIVYTSGTSGQPKGVMLSHFNLASNVSAVHDIFEIKTTDRSLSFLSWAHAFGQTAELYCLFSMGASLAIAESVDAIIANLAEVKPTLLFSVPRIFNNLYAAVQKNLASQPKLIQWLADQALAAAAKKRNGHSISLLDKALLTLADKIVFSKVRAKFGGQLRYAFSGGAAMSREVAELIDGLGILVYEGYGLTETSPIAAANYPGHRRIGSVGRALPGVRIAINSAGFEERTTGNRPYEEGEVVVYGSLVMKGYYKRPNETAAVLTLDGGLRTGDMGYLDEAGYLWITGRLKEQYKLENGRYVVPTALEEKLKLSPLITNVMIYGANRLYNVALVVPSVEAVCEALGQPKNSLSSNELLHDQTVRALFEREIARFSADFKSFEKIRNFALLASDFTTGNGLLTPSLKIKRRAVVEEYKALIDSL